ncbi:MAG TPA: prepilin-type N-terminal cleavage/methylation domain-containing protein [Trichocoleus sp.]
MASSPFAFRLYQTLHKQRKSSQRGFTLTELLVSIVMAGIIFTGLLFLVVEMLRADQSEAVLNQTQQDVNNAMEYITRDLQEAVFVYPNQTALDAIMGQLSDEPAGTPILAFWRVDPVNPTALASLLTSSSNCTSGSEAFKENCSVVALRQSTYTLVVYIQQNNTGNDIWQGGSRIIRYALPQYSNLATLTERAGYSDPAPNRFEAPTAANGPNEWRASGAVTAGTAAVLVDSIDTPTATVNGLTNCANLGTGYSRVPAADTSNTSFFTCIRDTTLTAAEQGALTVELNDDEVARNNQDLVVYLRGDATGNRAGLFTVYNTRSSLPTLESRILVRGILDKRP